jgi:hypothetical protein
MHDPFAEAIESTIFKNRVNEYQEIEKKQQQSLSGRVVRKFKTKLQSFLGKKDPIEEVNELLLKAGIIKIPLTHIEVWSVTDIHVEDLPYSNQQVFQ